VTNDGVHLIGGITGQKNEGARTRARPWHYSQFKITNGSVLRGPAARPLQVYRTEEKDGQLFVETKDKKWCDI
jgi:nitrite reductase/ring-hydroxylating ferredoxin subunit